MRKKKKMEINNYATARGIGFSGLLTIVFIVLKILNIIDWSWVWVLAPIWISFALWVIFFIIMFIIACLVNK